jgi:hypothetical protein
VEQRIYPQNSHRVVWALYGSENIDASNQIAVCACPATHGIIAGSRLAKTFAA